MRSAAIAVFFAFLTHLSAQNGAETRDLGQLSASFRALARQVNPSVVKVVAVGYRPLEEDETGEPGVAARQQSSGSGVIIGADGLIVTNAHVVMNAQRVQVTLPNPPEAAAPRVSTLRPSGRIVRAELIGLDLETDVALLKISETGLPALPLADSDAVEQGQIVMAFGSPLGLDNSVTLGVVSSAARQFRPDDPMIYIQTDAPINPGNSGGPLVDTEGRVVGINTLILSQSGGSEGLGFAVPSNIVANVVDQLVKGGRVVRGEIGVVAQTISPPLAAAWKLPRAWGVVIADVEEDGPGAKAGLVTGDVILTLNGRGMENARQFNVNVYRPAIGESVRLEILRGSQTLTLDVPVVERSDETERLAALGSQEENLIPELGVFATGLTPSLNSQLGPFRREHGVLVAARSADGPILEEGFQAGDVIYALNREATPTVGRLRALLRKLKSGDSLALQIERNGKLRFIAFELP
ncbi:MAG: trypsin-like peptidase domain-containing protein [Bryobacteraceae bacterium]|nr:trypsin-like peptidase domain-containing protein [Bryobacteraceae bacterium]